MSVHFKSETDDWYTPQYLFDELNAEFQFQLDPCCSEHNAKCQKYLTIDDDGLSHDWDGMTVFMNPPYGRQIKHWMKKANDEAKKGSTVVCLIPARTDTKWWHESVIQHEVRFIKGRLKFGGAKNNAPFPSAIVVIRPESELTNEQAIEILKELNYTAGWPSSAKALTLAIQALRKADHVERIRDFCNHGASCGVMRSMENTIKSNVYRNTLHFIDSLEAES